MTAATAQIAITLTAEQIRNAYQALSEVPTACRAEMLALFEEHNAEWKYQLPGDAYFRMQQLEDRETAAIQTMGILAAHAAILGVPVTY
jgi:hypothetical protein